MVDNNLITSQDGSHTIRSEKFGVTYHSIYGAIHESITVFLSAGLQYHLLQGKMDLSIFEMGFGTGLNALLTMIEAHQSQATINYTAIEKYPLPSEITQKLNYNSQLNTHGYQRYFELMHHCKPSEKMSITDQFIFSKIVGDLFNFEPEEKYDIIYYDAFAPSAQPNLWTEEAMHRMYDMLHCNGTLVTYCAKGSFKRALKNSGFLVEAIPGPPGKREMTRAHKEK